MAKEFDARTIIPDIVTWIRRWFDANGKDCTAVIGISGGKDSTVVAGLCVEALGAGRVIGVMMPNGFQEDIKDAYQLVRHLGIRAYEIDISRMVNATLAEVRGRISPIYDLTQQSKINCPPRIRMTVLYAVAQSLNGRVANTCNLSEDYVGYSTKYGDSAGDFAPLKDFTSEEVVAIGEALGLPENLIKKTPSDGLCGKTDEANLGFSYAELNRYIRTGEIDDAGLKQKIDTLHEKNLFKERPIERFEYALIDRTKTDQKNKR